MKKLLIAGLAAIVLLAGGTFVRSGKQTAAPSLSDIMAEAQAASVDYFLKIDGIDGESTDSGHKNEIDVESWSWGETNMGTTSGGGGGGAGKVSMQDFHFTMKLSKATPKLMLALAQGEHIKDAKLTLRDSSRKGNPEYYVITMQDILVTSYQTGGSSGQIPTESISLNFTKIEWTYMAADGRVIRGGWDLGQNKPI